MSVGVWHMKSIGTFQNLLRRSFWNLPESFKTLKNQYGTNIVTKLPNEGRPCSRLLWVIAALGCWPSNPIFECIFFGNSIVYRNHRIYGGSPTSLCWLWWQSTIWKLSEMVDYEHTIKKTSKLDWIHCLGVHTASPIDAQIFGMFPW